MKYEKMNQQTIASFNHHTRANEELPKKKLKIKKDIEDIKDCKGFTIDLQNAILVDECHSLMSFMSEILDSKIIYVIEKKIKNNQPHVHGYFYSKNTLSKIKKEFHKYLHGTHYDVREIFSLNGWQSYITKENPNVHSVGQSF